MEELAERAGFEPAVLSHTAFRERHHQPLGHLSVNEDTKGLYGNRSGGHAGAAVVARGSGPTAGGGTHLELGGVALHDPGDHQQALPQTLAVRHLQG